MAKQQERREGWKITLRMYFDHRPRERAIKELLRSIRNLTFYDDVTVAGANISHGKYVEKREWEWEVEI